MTEYGLRFTGILRKSVSNFKVIYLRSRDEPVVDLLRTARLNSDCLNESVGQVIVDQLCVFASKVEAASVVDHYEYQ